MVLPMIPAHYSEHPYTCSFQRMWAALSTASLRKAGRRQFPVRVREQVQQVLQVQLRVLREQRLRQVLQPGRAVRAMR